MAWFCNHKTKFLNDIMMTTFNHLYIFALTALCLLSCQSTRLVSPSSKMILSEIKGIWDVDQVIINGIPQDDLCTSHGYFIKTDSILTRTYERCTYELQKNTLSIRSTYKNGFSFDMEIRKIAKDTLQMHFKNDLHKYPCYIEGIEKEAFESVVETWVRVKPINP